MASSGVISVNVGRLEGGEEDGRGAVEGDAVFAAYGSSSASSSMERGRGTAPTAPAPFETRAGSAFIELGSNGHDGRDALAVTASSVQQRQVILGHVLYITITTCMTSGTISFTMYPN